MECARCIRYRQTPRLCLEFGRWSFQEIDYWQRHGQGRRDDLHRLTVHYFACRTQSFVALYKLIDALLQYPRIEEGKHADCGGNIIRGTAGYQLIDIPETLLPKRQWHDAAQFSTGYIALLNSGLQTLSVRVPIEQGSLCLGKLRSIRHPILPCVSRRASRFAFKT
jgi:hypothetical protein